MYPECSNQIGQYLNKDLNNDNGYCSVYFVINLFYCAVKDTTFSLSLSLSHTHTHTNQIIVI